MYRRIVVGTDNSVAARSTVEFAADLARGDGAQLHIAALHSAYHCYSIDHLDGMLSAQETGHELILDVHRMHLELLARQLRRRAIDVSIHVVAGDPAVRLIDLAVELGADLVIVGRGEVTRRRRHLSSVAVSVVRTAMVPVLVVPTISGTSELDER